MTTAIATRPRRVEGHDPRTRPRPSRRAGGVGAHGDRARTTRRAVATDTGRRPAPACPRAATRRTSPRRGRRDRAFALLAVALVLAFPVARGLAAEASTDAVPVANAYASVGEPQTQEGTAPAGSGYVVVGEGETLWDLVLPHAPEGSDAAAYVAQVVALNDLDPRTLQPGAVIRLP